MKTIVKNEEEILKVGRLWGISKVNGISVFNWDTTKDGVIIRPLKTWKKIREIKFGFPCIVEYKTFWG